MALDSQDNVARSACMHASPEVMPAAGSASAVHAETRAPQRLFNGAISTLALATAACGGDGGSTAAPGTPGAPVATVAKPQSDSEAAQFILRAGLSVSDADIKSIKANGYEPWLDAQLNSSISQTGTAWLTAQGYDQVTTKAYFDNSYPGDQMIWTQLMTSPDSVRKRVALALSEVFVVSLSLLNIRWPGSAIAHYWDQLNANAFGNFRTLLEDVTLNPAMGDFLNTRGNRKEDPKTGRQPDENYAREVMQLFTIGLHELNQDGTAKLDVSGKPIETYTNDDVTNLAHVFTGYDWDYTGNVNTSDPRGTGRTIPSTQFVLQPMTTDFAKWQRPQSSSQHSDLAATFLGTTVPANTPASQSLKIALDTLFNHPNAGPFFAKQMIQRLVTSNPSPAYVSRVAAVFGNNGAGVRGDLRAVFKVILLDDEALNSAANSDPRFGKLREPVLRLVQWGRTFGATSTSGTWDLGDLSEAGVELSQSPLRSPSVFNFFRPGYVPPNSTAAANSLVAPEFQLVNETTIAGYVNYMTSAIGSGAGRNREVKAQYADEIAIAHDAAALLDRVSLLLTAGQISAATKATIRTALDAVIVTQTSADTDKLRRVYLAVLLVMASPEYLVQK